jgi:hypothetical protein
MQLSDIFLGLGEESLTQLLKGISIGKLKTYQLYERLKTRTHVSKLNSETLRKSTPRLWNRLTEHDDELAQDLAQAILVSHLDMIQAVLDFVGIPHEDGFFAKDTDPSKYLNEGWKQRVYDEFRERFSAPLILFYVNHLAWEVEKDGQVFAPAA